MNECCLSEAECGASDLLGWDFPKERKLQMLLLMSLLITRDENSEMMEEA